MTFSTSHPGFHATIALDAEYVGAHIRESPVMVVHVEQWRAVRDLLFELVRSVRVECGAEEVCQFCDRPPHDGPCDPAELEC